MRLRERDLQTVYLKKRVSTQDDEGNDIITYSNEAKEFKMNVQSAGGQVMAQLYGESLPYIKACKYQGDLLKAGENELDGVCVEVLKDVEPDYEILAIQHFSTHLNVTLKKRGGADGS